MKKNYLLFIFFIISICVSAQIVDIPDPYFKAELLANTEINTTDDGEISISEAEAFSGRIEINQNSDITNLTGLEAFVNLTELHLYWMLNIENGIDISKNINLTYLHLVFLSLNELDITNNSKLEYLSVGSNSLTSLNISNNLELRELYCGSNSLTSIDLSNNLKLTHLDTSYSNSFNSLDLSSHIFLQSIICDDNNLQSLNIANGNNTIITKVEADDNLLSCIQVDDVIFAQENENWIKDNYPSYSTNCTGEEGQAIVNIPDVNFKSILLENTYLNVNNDDEIQEFEAYNHQGTSGQLRIYDSNLIEDLTGIETFIKVEQLYLNRTNISSLDLSGNTNLYYISMQSNQLLTDINVSNNIDLRTFYLSNSPLTSIDISNNTNLTRLEISGTDVSEINTSNNINLNTFECNYNDSLSSLDFLNNINLTDIECIGNNLTSLDITNNNALTSIDFSYNKLENLNVANGGNTNITTFNTIGNDKLFCIQVDDVSFSNTNWTDKDGYSEFTTDCSNYTPIEYTLTTEAINGAITFSPESTNGIYVKGTEVTLTVTPNEGFQFEGWDGYTETDNSLTITMDDNKSVIALFDTLQITSTEVATNGTITKNIAPVNGTYDYNTEIEYTAVANEGYRFDYLTAEYGRTISTSYVNPTTIILDEDKIITAYFNKVQSLTIIDNYDNNAFYISKTPNEADNIYDYNIEITITANPYTGYQFDGWDEYPETSNSLTITMDEDKTITPLFSKIQHTIDITAENGTVSVDTEPTNGTYDYGTEVTLNATPDEGYQFDGWEGYTETASSLTITIDQDKTITAIFSKIQNTLDITAENGTVSVNTEPTNGTYDYGTEVTLTATPDIGYQFDGWNGYSETASSLTITIDQDKNVTALFSKIQHTLDITTENGAVSVDPNPTNGTYDYGTEITLTATPDEGYQFDGWSGDAAGTMNPITITVDEDKTVTALFSKTQHTLDITAENGTVSVDTEPTNGTYDYGTEVTLTANPDEGYQFDGWDGYTETASSLTITIDQDKNVTALFSKIQHTLDITAENGTVAVDTNPTNGTYDYGTEITLTATPDEGYQFDGWDGYTETSSSLTITIDEDKTATAIFSEIANQLDISTFATGFTSLEGIAINSDNEVYVSQTSGEVYELDANGNQSLFTTSSFNANDIVFNSENNLFIAAPFFGKIMQADVSGNITEYSDAFGNSPQGISFYNDNLYYTGSGTVYEVDENLTKTTYADGFFSSTGIAFDSNGDAYVADNNDRKLYKVSSNGTKTEVANGYAAIRGVAIANDIVYFTTYTFNTNKVIKYDPATGITEDYVTTNLDEPRYLEIDKLGNMYVANSGDGTVTKIYDENLEPQATASIFDETFNSAFNIYPNPTSNYINISYSDIDSITNITLIDISGKEISTSTASKIDVSNLNNGVYILRVVTDNGKIAIKRFIKK